ncbi:ribonuclease HII [Hyunsoonleella sp. 2307UL5-6]|uniref:ribonuclease HII n=1 Tax=Hyunsoonleella sp. 2307UL5-6 TaxID=3384768 RepID=UPI0039BD8894
MRFFLCSLLLLVALSCSNSKNKQPQLIDVIPSNSEVVFKSSNIESLKTAIINNTFINSLSDTKAYKNLKHLLNPLKKISIDGNILLCFSKSELDSLQYTLITKFSSVVFQTDSLKNYTEENLKYTSYDITKSTLNTHEFYSVMVDSIFVVSSSKEIVTKVFNNKSNTSPFKKLHNVVSDSDNVSVLLKTNSALAPSFFMESDLKSTHLTDFITLDVELSQDAIFFDGIAKSLDLSTKVIDIFKNTIPQEHKIQHITPGNSDGYLSFTFDDFNIIHKNISVFHNKDSTSIDETLFNSIIEIGVIYEDDKRAVVLNSIDAIATQEALLSEQNIIDTYRNISLFEFSKPNLFQDTFNPLLNNITVSKYCVIDSYFVFANSIEALQNIIANYKNKTTFSSKSSFKELSTNLSSESSLVFVAKPQLLKQVIKDNLNKLYDIDLKPYNISAIQFVYDTNFAHIHGGIIKGNKKRVQHSISERFSLKLDADLLNTPQIVTNHITNQKEIIVQDINNNLYLISNKGNVIWKKQLKGALLGEISQIDMYKNGRLQLAFATTNRVYIVDRKGRDVTPFPLKFKDDVTQPLSVFDYDKNKNYRLLVTQGKNVLMYDIKGKIVSGFSFKSTKNDIISCPKHFRIGTKDYIVLKTKSKLYILDRVGKTRVSPKTKNIFSDEPVFLYQNKFTTTDSNGQLISIDTRGNVSSINLKLSAAHNLETTSKTRVTLHGNKLGIKSRIIELDYGNYTRPRIFYLNDKIYVTITDLQSKKVFLYDSQGKLIPNFPVYGNSLITLDNIDGDRNLEFVTKGDTNSIILYKIN